MVKGSNRINKSGYYHEALTSVDGNKVIGVISKIHKYINNTIVLPYIKSLYLGKFLFYHSHPITLITALLVLDFTLLPVPITSLLAAYYLITT